MDNNLLDLLEELSELAKNLDHTNGNRSRPRSILKNNKRCQDFTEETFEQYWNQEEIDKMASSMWFSFSDAFLDFFKKLF